MLVYVFVGAKCINGSCFWDSGEHMSMRYLGIIVLRGKAQASPFFSFESIKSRMRRFFFFLPVHSILSTVSNVHWLIQYSSSGQSAPFTIRPKSYVNWCAEHHFWDLLVYVEKFNRALLCAGALMVVEPAGELRHITFMHIHHIHYIMELFFLVFSQHLMVTFSVECGAYFVSRRNRPSTRSTRKASVVAE